MSTAAVRRYWTQIAAFGCLVCGGPAEIAHCHGGSILDRGYTKAKGKKLAYMDWLVLPLCPFHHRLSMFSLDLNAKAFERINGEQVMWINQLIGNTGIDVWNLARSRHEHKETT